MIMQERECRDKQGHKRGGAWMRKEVEKREKMKMLGEKHCRQMTMMKAVWNADVKIGFAAKTCCGETAQINKSPKRKSVGRKEQKEEWVHHPPQHGHRSKNKKKVAASHLNKTHTQHHPSKMGYPGSDNCLVNYAVWTVLFTNNCR